MLYPNGVRGTDLEPSDLPGELYDEVIVFEMGTQVHSLVYEQLLEGCRMSFKACEAQIDYLNGLGRAISEDTWLLYHTLKRVITDAEGESGQDG